MPGEEEIREREEKEEKEEKDDGDWGSEKWSGEKWSGEKWSRDPLGSITWALILIWAGVVFLIGNLSGDGEAFLGLDWG